MKDLYLERIAARGTAAFLFGTIGNKAFVAELKRRKSEAAVNRIAQLLRERR
jgi:hypothetical protein